MFIGHYALALASRKIDRRPSLAMLFIAVQLLDLIWPVLVLLGIETFRIEPGITALTPLNFTHYPWSHSLMMTVVWSVVLGVVYFVRTKNAQGSLLLGGLVASHWVLDVLVHRPDLPLTPFTTLNAGLGLWNYPALEIALEMGLFLAGTFLYYRAAQPRRRIAFWSLIGFFIAVYVLNFLGPPPPSIAAVAWSANLMWLMVLWAWWIERAKP